MADGASSSDVQLSESQRRRIEVNRKRARELLKVRVVKQTQQNVEVIGCKGGSNCLFINHYTINRTVST